jgi:hypothetical protein
MGLWTRMKRSWQGAKQHDEEVEKQAVIDRHMRDLERQQQDQSRGVRLPPRGDRG